MMQIERELSTPPLMRTLFNQVRNPTIESGISPSARRRGIGELLY